jgi:hypothetical protein
MFTRSVTTLGAGVCLIAYFLLLAGLGMRIGFSHDDLMNLCRAELLSTAGHARDIALFFVHSPTYRPLGSLFYRVIYGAVGFEPEVYRVASFVLLTANLGLAYLLARRLSGSERAGLWTALLFAFHGEMSPLYTSTGFIYDILCFTFVCASFLFYLWSRRDGRVPGLGAMAVWTALYVLSLNAKEMAVALPVWMAAWEWWQRPRASWRTPLWGGVVTAAFVLGRVCGAGGLSANGGYVPDVRAAVYLDRGFHFLWFTAYRAEWFTGVHAALFCAVLVAIAAAWRCTAFRLALVWMAVGILPVAFIDQRSLAAVYLPFFGLALALALLAEAVRESLPWAARDWQFAVVWLGMALFLYRFHDRHNPMPVHLERGEHVTIGAVAADLARWRSQLRCAQRILIARDPFPQYDWNSFFLVALLAADPHVTTPACAGPPPDLLSPDRVITPKRAQPGTVYDLVLSHDNGEWRELTYGEWRESRSRE